MNVHLYSVIGYILGLTVYTHTYIEYNRSLQVMNVHLYSVIGYIHYNVQYIRSDCLTFTLYDT